MTSIEWTDETWNPAIGCSRVSEGCRNCYAERFVHRGLSAAHAGLTVLRSDGPGWTGEVRLLPERLDEPIRWRKGRRIFVCSLSDLFHPEIPFPFVAAVLGVIAETPRHRYQILTKRPERAREFLAWLEGPTGEDAAAARLAWYAPLAKLALLAGSSEPSAPHALPLPLPNLDLLVSVEDQRTADKRIPELLELGGLARTLGVSYEPALGPVDFRCIPANYPGAKGDYLDALVGREWYSGSDVDDPRASAAVTAGRVAWVIVGGESGPGARPFDVAWARSTIEQCRAADVPVFVKQLGGFPYDSARGTLPKGSPVAHGEIRARLLLADRKGGEILEWPEDLRVRELPK